MPDIGAAKVDAAFIPMKKSKNLLLICCLHLLLLAGCTEEDPQAQIPFATVDIELNLQDLRYQSLHTEGWIYVAGGVKGIVIVKESNSLYRAFERTCTYQPRETCARVDMHSSGFYLIDNCCKSQFDKFGNVTNGPASQPLLQYNTYMSGNFLIIRN